MASGFILIRSRIDDQLGRGAMHNWQVGKIWKQKQPPLIILERTHTFASGRSYKRNDKMIYQTTQDVRAKKSDSAGRLYIEARSQHRGGKPTQHAHNTTPEHIQPPHRRHHAHSKPTQQHQTSTSSRHPASSRTARSKEKTQSRRRHDEAHILRG